MSNSGTRPVRTVVCTSWSRFFVTERRSRSRAPVGFVNCSGKTLHTRRDTHTVTRRVRTPHRTVRACTVTSPKIKLPTSFETANRNTRVFRFELQDYLFLNKINPLQGNAITIHSMSMTLGV